MTSEWKRAGSGCLLSWITPNKYIRLFLMRTSYLGALEPSLPRPYDLPTMKVRSIYFDLSQPLPASFARKFSLIVDGGTLEHIYDVPQCIRNIARLLDVPGTFLSISCANNFMGHGSYQFSPEFYFRALSPEGGFHVDEVILTEVHRDAQWYTAIDPALARQRVELANCFPTYIMVRATKIDSGDVSALTPKQSDYEFKMWIDGSTHIRETRRPTCEAQPSVG